MPLISFDIRFVSDLAQGSLEKIYRFGSVRNSFSCWFRLVCFLFESNMNLFRTLRLFAMALLSIDNGTRANMFVC